VTPVAVPEDPEEQSEVLEPELTEAEEEVGEDLPECPDHRPSLFERGKPRSIFPRFANNLLLTLLNLMHYV
jgi:hypothetical protein